MILSFTGHRPDKLGESNNPLPAGATILAADFLRAARPDSCIVGMAQGWDMAVAYACTQFNIPFTAAIPFLDQPLFWPESVKKVYNEILASPLGTTIIVAPGGYSAGKMSLRNGWMVDHSDAVIALWNGTSGGTGNCVRYARTKKKPILNLWDTFERNDPTTDQAWRNFNDCLRRG